MLFPIIINGSLGNNIDWKDTTSEGFYSDFNIKTQSKIIPEKQNHLNYTVNFSYNSTKGLPINYYPILELENNIKKILEQKSLLLNGNHTDYYDLVLESGKNKWSIVIESSDLDFSTITHHGNFDEVHHIQK